LSFLNTGVVVGVCLLSAVALSSSSIGFVEVLASSSFLYGTNQLFSEQLGPAFYQ